MATERKPLFMSTEGYSEEVATTDYMTISKLTIPVSGSGGVGIVMNSNKITGLGSGTASGDALAFGQSGAQLGSTTFTADVNAGQNQITNVGDPTDPEDAANKQYVDAVVAGLDPHASVVAKTAERLGTSGLLWGSGGSWTGALVAQTMDIKFDADVGWTTITFSSPANIAAAVSQINTQYGSTVAYVNGSNVDLRSTTKGTSSAAYTQNVNATITSEIGIQNNGSNTGAWMTASGTGVGKYLEAATKGSYMNAIDGVSLAVNDRVLVSMEGGSDPTGNLNNGLYTVTTLGDNSSAKLKLTRATDADQATSTEMHQGLYTFVTGGTTYTNTGWTEVLIVATIDTSDIKFTQFSGAPGYTFDQGLIKAVNSVKVDLDTSADAGSAGAGGGSSGLEFDVDAAGGKLRAAVSATGALKRASDGLSIKLEASTPTLQVDISNQLGVKLSDGLKADSNGTAVALDASGSGLEFTGTAGDGTLGIKLEASNPSLQIDGSNQLGAKLDGNKGTAKGTDGIYVKIDGASITYNGSGQLQASSSSEASRVENTLTTATDSIAVADPIYINGADTVGKADAGVEAKSRVIGINRSGSGAAPQNIEVVSMGPAVGVLSGATPNTPYYLQDGGGIGISAPGTGKRVVQIGWAKNATDLWVELKDFGKRASA